MRILTLLTLLLLTTQLTAQQLTISNFNVQRSDTLSMNFDRYYSKSAAAKVTSFDQLGLQCQEVLGPDLDMFEIFESCLSLGTINILKLHMGDENTAKFTESFHLQELEYKLAQRSGQDLVGKVKTETITIQNFKLTSKNGHFAITGRMTSAMNAKLKVTGTMVANRELKTLTLTIEKARASFVNIKARILNAFRDAALENVIVEGDRVIVSFTPE